MQASALPFMSDWLNFYVVIGSAAATLTGLMFVVTTLLTGIEKHVSTLNAGISAFNTPTITHFCVVLLIAAILSAPWETLTIVKALLSLVGLWAVGYLIVVSRRMRAVPGHPTPLKDWLWYLVFPLIAYIVLIAAAIILLVNPVLVLYIVSAVMVVLLFIGIHNAWDLVTYLAIERSHPNS